MSKLLDKILNEISLDSRIPNGVFDIAENNHMDVLREYLTSKGIEEEAVREFCNRVVEGKYPERQAYNAKGILVTFPTPEYKQRAIQRGTHFEKDPTKRPPNVFGGAEAPQQAAAPAGDAQQQPPTGKTSLPLSQAQPAEPTPDQPQPDAQAQAPTTTAAPAASAVPSEPAPEPTELPPSPSKSPAEKDAEKAAIKKMLKGDDVMLERVVNYVLEHRDISLCYDIIAECQCQSKKL